MQKGNKILIVEDEFIVANDLRMILKKNGYEVVGIASSVSQAKTIIATTKPNWVLLDILLKGSETGIDLAIELNKLELPFLFISANTNQGILEAVKETRPYGFLTKPFREKDLFIMLDIANERLNSENKAEEPKIKSIENRSLKNQLIGTSPALNEVLSQVELVAPTDTSVLLLGESGTGKEKIAQSLHQLSLRKQQPLVVVNCAAIPLSLMESELFGHEKGAFTGAQNRRIGKFELADGGTIFLDEIGELPLEAQTKLLRVLQEQEIDRVGGELPVKINVRIIAATNRNLEQEVALGNFRLDLYYRLNIFPIAIPPLRERTGDIEVLANYFLAFYATKLKKNVTAFSAQVLANMQAYPWPGNIREMQHLIERTVLLAKDPIINDMVFTEHLESKISDFSSQKLASLEEIEREHILRVLESCKGKISGPGGATEILQISSSSLYSKMKKFGIKSDFY
ncbi:sigma-54 dependent transcriptional regulator [Sphingobacterium sp. 18053]|uniref:sigma-54-dependent transcriptional regulator n=1 Tax=Sphingobacterium sp. 18053 TaxID=2681401 RepID=UPI00135C79A1|nr:sigma-54 dependent transcriptional regulator [Sphingobacterium sp. 18053]